MATWTKEVVDLSVAGSSLTVDSIKIDGANIGHTDDTDLLSLASGTLTVNGALSGVTTLATSGNATIGGDLTVTGNTLTFGNGEIVSNDNDENITFTSANFQFSSITKSINNQVTIRSKTNYDTQLIFAEGTIMGIKWSIGNDATNDKLIIDAGTATLGGATKLSLDSSGNMVVAGDLTVTGNDIKDDDGTTCITFDSSGNTTIGGNLTSTGILDVTDTTDSANISGDSGALRCEGGASIAKNLYVGGNVYLGDSTSTDNIVNVYNNLQLIQVGTSGNTAESGRPNFVIKNYDDDLSSGVDNEQGYSNITFQTSRSDTIAHVATQDGNHLGRLAWYGNHGSDFAWAGQMGMKQQGAITNDKTPSEWYANSGAVTSSDVSTSNLTWGASNSANNNNRPNLIIDGTGDNCTAGMGSQIMIKNGTAPSSAINNYTCIGSKNIDGSDSALEITQEEAVASEAVTSDRTLKVTINGAVYKILLDYVSGE